MINRHQNVFLKPSLVWTILILNFYIVDLMTNLKMDEE